MHIVCPNCGTSYDVAPSALGAAGRAVRCVRCRETWHAHADDMTRADALVQAAEEIGWDQTPLRQAATANVAAAEPFERPIPQVESPPLAHGGPTAAAHEWTAQAQDDAPIVRQAPNRQGNLRKFAFGSGPAKGLGFSPPMAIAAMAALVLALIVWRNDVVRLLPQTAAFFQFTGLSVNLRNLAFEDVRVSTETVNGSRVFVIEGAIAPTSRKAVEIPRLRFVVQDARGADIYAWNAVVDQAVIRPGERVAFKSRLASPPADAHSVVVRFFHRRDLASGSV
jgi:predicted Zn finger-like uncharacterized protein